MKTEPTPTYDLIGRGYIRHRRPDPRIARMIQTALGDARTVVNIGAGTGSYEPPDRIVVAVEPSREMILQRPPDAAPTVQCSAENLPFADNEFDAAMATLTMHHWTDQQRGLDEMKRVARDVVVLLTWDPEVEPFWLVRDYFPEFIGIDRAIFPALDRLEAMLGSCTITPVPIPFDCIDGFLGAYWRRPEAYLEESVRRGISSFSKVTDVEPRIERLRGDIASGAWRRRNPELLDADELDLGYRLVVHRRANESSRR